MQLERFEELCSAYVLDALDSAERQEFEAALESATEEQLEIFTQLSTTSQLMAMGYEPVEPASHVKDAIMNKVAVVDTPKRKEPLLGTNFGFWDVITKAVVPAALVIVIGIQYRAHLKQEAQIAQNQAVFEILKSPNLEVVQMAGLGVSPNSIGKVFWDKNTGQAVVQFIDLPKPPEGKDYQLWVISGNTPISAGVFSFADDKGSLYFQTETLGEKDPAKIQAFAVTLEEKGGVPAPAGEMYLKGAI